MTKITKNIIVFYHEHCTDGFASAYTAWKKFKDNAEYIALSHTVTDEDILKSKKVKINDLKEKEIYFIDFCPKETELKKIQKVAKKLVVIDHHIGAKDLVESLVGSVFRNGVSGAYLAHEYFFPKKDIPKIIKYISAGDTYNWGSQKFEREILAYIYTLNFDFKTFQKAERDIEDKKKFLEIKNLGETLQTNYLNMVEAQIDNAVLVNFEGHDVYAVNASVVFRNELGAKLAQKSKSKFAIIYTFTSGELKVSLRGEGKTDLNLLVQKYSGGGHFNASAFRSNDPVFINDFIKKVIKSNE